MSLRTAIHVIAGALRALLLVAGSGIVACAGEDVTLGAGDAEPSFSDAGQSVRNLNLERNEEYDPTLTDDLLHIYFISDRPDGVGGKDVWHAERRARTDPFGPPSVFSEASSSVNEESVAVSGDGSTLWVGSRRAGGKGGIDIWRISRSEPGGDWGEIEPVEALNSELDDLPRPPGQRGAVLPIASNRGGGALLQMYLATRSGPQDDFGPLEPLDDLWDVGSGEQGDTGSSMEDGFLSGDGLHLFFRRARPGQEGTLYVTWRRSIDERFGAPVALDVVNSDYDERDPFVSADNSRFFFASNRRDGTDLDIYATRSYLPTYR
jgi:hypothetical protein